MWVTPVIDRTYSDIVNKTSKAYYNAFDFNRIEGNCKELAQMLNVQITTKTDWSMSDFPTASHVNRIVDNVDKLRQAYYTYPNTPTTPDMPINNYNKANALERIQNDVYKLFVANSKAYYYTGEISCGDDIGVI